MKRYDTDSAGSRRTELPVSELGGGKTGKGDRSRNAELDFSGGPDIEKVREGRLHGDRQTITADRDGDVIPFDIDAPVR